MLETITTLVNEGLYDVSKNSREVFIQRENFYTIHDTNPHALYIYVNKDATLDDLTMPAFSRIPLFEICIPEFDENEGCYRALQIPARDNDIKKIMEQMGITPPSRILTEQLIQETMDYVWEMRRQSTNLLEDVFLIAKKDANCLRKENSLMSNCLISLFCKMSA